MDSDRDTLERALAAGRAIASTLGLSHDPSWGDIVAAVTALVDRNSAEGGMWRERIAEAFGLPSDTNWKALEDAAGSSDFGQCEADFEALTNRYQDLAEEHEATKRNLRRALDSVTNLSQICLSDHDA